MIVVVPHGLHGVKVDAQDVAVVVAHETIVLIHRHARLDAGAAIALDHIAQRAMHLELAVAQAFILIDCAILSWPKQELPHCDGRRVVSSPAALGFGVAAPGVGNLVSGQVYSHMAKGLVVGDAVTHIEAAVESRVKRHRPLDGISHIEGAAAQFPGGIIKEIDLTT